MVNDNIIETHNLTRYYGKNCVVNELNLSVPRGCVFGLLGRNGAGKSTTLRMLIGLLEPTRGSAQVLGHDCTKLTPEVRGRIGYLSESHCVYRWMRVREFGEFQKNTFPRWNQSLFDNILEHFRLRPEQKAGELSRGQRGGLCLAATLATEPELIILDDPALGLDPIARRSLLQAILFASQTGNQTIIFSSHQLADVERVADHIAVMHLGSLRACCPLESFRERVRRYIIRHTGESPKLPEIAGLLDVFRMPGEVSLTVANPDSDLLQTLKKLDVQSVEEQPISLEDAFISYAGEREEKSLFMHA